MYRRRSRPSNARQHYNPDDWTFADRLVGELVAGAVVFAVFAGIGVVLALFV